MTDGIFDPAPTQLAAVLDRDWLQAMLRSRWDGVVVRGVRVVETLVTQATKVRVELDLDAAGDPAPRALCIKGILTQTDVPASASLVETHFYRNLAAKLPVRVPDCIYSGLSADGGNGVIVMRDLTAAGAQFLTALSPVSVTDAGATLAQLAALHAAGWQHGALFTTAAAPRFLDMIATRPIMPLDQLQRLIDGTRSAGLPSAVTDAARLQSAVIALAQRVRAADNCLVHGDAHAGNIYRTADGFGLIDWQVFQSGHWAQDVAYHIATVLTPDQRRAAERELLAGYCDALAQAGGPRLAPATAWGQYRAAMIYGYFLWAITRKVAPEVTNMAFGRLGIAVDDLDSFAALSV